MEMRIITIILFLLLLSGCEYIFGNSIASGPEIAYKSDDKTLLTETKRKYSDTYVYYEIYKYPIDRDKSSLYFTYMYTFVNTDDWQKLPEDYKALINKDAQSIAKDICQNTYSYSEPLFPRPWISDSKRIIATYLIC